MGSSVGVGRRGGGARRSRPDWSPWPCGRCTTPGAPPPPPSAGPADSAPLPHWKGTCNEHLSSARRRPRCLSSSSWRSRRSRPSLGWMLSNLGWVSFRWARPKLGFVFTGFCCTLDDMFLGRREYPFIILDQAHDNTCVPCGYHTIFFIGNDFSATSRNFIHTYEPFP